MITNKQIIGLIASALSVLLAYICRSFSGEWVKCVSFLLFVVGIVSLFISVRDYREQCKKRRLKKEYNDIINKIDNARLQMVNNSSIPLEDFKMNAYTIDQSITTACNYAPAMKETSAFLQYEGIYGQMKNAFVAGDKHTILNLLQSYQTKLEDVISEIRHSAGDWNTYWRRF